MSDVEDDNVIDNKNAEAENLFAKNLIGMTITDASFSFEQGYMIELDGRIRFRSCCEHAAFFRRTVQ
jgi:hypothetical protein